MINYTLYVKVHRKTGLRYLGQTTKNPFNYNGSGIDWIKHLTRFGKDIETIILLQTQSWKELTYWGRYYSNLWHVTMAVDNFGNRIWANRIHETGGAGNAGMKLGKYDSARVERQKKGIATAKTIETEEEKKNKFEIRSKARRGKKPWNKGLSKDSDRRVLDYSNSKVGKVRHDMIGKTPWNKGKKCSNLSKALQGRAAPNKGKPSPNKGKTYEELYGVEKAEELRRLRRLNMSSKMGNKKNKV
jgi:hypothetical protein